MVKQKPAPSLFNNFSEEKLRDMVITLTSVVQTPPQRLKVILSSKSAMVAFLEANREFLPVAGIDIDELVEEKEKSNKEVVTSTEVISTKKEKEENVQPTKKTPPFKKEKVETIFKKTILPVDEPTLFVETYGTDDILEVTYYPLKKVISKDKLQDTSLYQVVTSYNGLQYTIYDIHRKQYIFTFATLEQKLTELLEEYEYIPEMVSKQILPSFGFANVFYKVEDNESQLLPGFVLKNSYSSAASPSLTIGVMNKQNSVFLPLTTKTVKIEDISSKDSIEELVKEYVTVTRKIDNLSETKVPLILSYLKNFVKDPSAVNKRSKTVTELIVK